jgi:hypothetical protein
MLRIESSDLVTSVYTIENQTSIKLLIVMSVSIYVYNNPKYAFLSMYHGLSLDSRSLLKLVEKEFFCIIISGLLL